MRGMPGSGADPASHSDSNAQPGTDSRAYAYACPYATSDSAAESTAHPTSNPSASGLSCAAGGMD